MDSNNAPLAYFNPEKWPATMVDAHNGRRWEYRLNHKETLESCPEKNLNVDRQRFPTSLGTRVR